MIATSAAAGKFCKENSIAVPFRGQPPREARFSVSDRFVSHRVARELLKLRGMPRSSTSLEAHPHSGLAVEAYSQVTSPIRRATDLLSHYQIRMYLSDRKRAMYSRSRLSATVDLVNERVQTVRGIERSSVRYWVLAVLWRLFIGDSSSDSSNGAQVESSSAGDLGLVFLLDFGETIVCSLPARAYIGDVLKVTIQQSDPRSNFVRAHAQRP